MIVSLFFRDTASWTADGPNPCTSVHRAVAAHPVSQFMAVPMSESSEIQSPTRPNLTVVGAGCMGLAGFSVALLAGLISNNPFDTVVIRGLFALVACFPLGCAIGYAMERIIAEHSQRMNDKLAEPSSRIHNSSTESQHKPNRETENEAA